MAELKNGSVTVIIPDHVQIPEKAGKLTMLEVRRLGRARRGLGLTSEKTAEAMEKNPQRFMVRDLTPAKLAADGKAAEDIDGVITDLETLLEVLKQANQILDVQAHENLRRVMAYVRSQEKFDPRISDLVPHLVGYFANTRAKTQASEEDPATEEGQATETPSDT